MGIIRTVLCLLPADFDTVQFLLACDPYAYIMLPVALLCMPSLACFGDTLSFMLDTDLCLHLWLLTCLTFAL